MRNLRALAAALAAVLLALLPWTGLADDAGALSEDELTAWISQLLLDTKDLRPLNAPVDEQALTEDGYAFVYDFATLYFDRPARDEASVLQAISLTAQSYAAPRGVRLGDDEMALLVTFGWQNLYLTGDGSLAAFYRVEDLPRAAYWSWARHDEDWTLTGVQCAVHVLQEDGRYTDAGLRFELEAGAVSSIRVYGLNQSVSLADVRANLSAVQGVEEAIQGELCE